MRLKMSRPLSRARHRTGSDRLHAAEGQLADRQRPAGWCRSRLWWNSFGGWPSSFTINGAKIATRIRKHDDQAGAHRHLVTLEPGPCDAPERATLDGHCVGLDVRRRLVNDLGRGSTGGSGPITIATLSASLRADLVAPNRHAAAQALACAEPGALRQSAADQLSPAW